MSSKWSTAWSPRQQQPLRRPRCPSFSLDDPPQSPQPPPPQPKPSRPKQTSSIFWLHLLATLLLAMRCDTPVWLVWVALLGAGTLQASVMRGELFTLTDLCAVALWRITEEHEASAGSSSARVACHFGTYHLVFAIFKWWLDPRGSRASTKMVAYTVGAASTAAVHWLLLPDTADDAKRGAMALVTPWYWCLYTLTGFYLFACLAAYKGIQLLLSYSAAQFASVRGMALAEPLTPATVLVCAAVALASLANLAFVAMKTKHKLSEFTAHTLRLGRWLLQRRIQFQRSTHNDNDKQD